MKTKSLKFFSFAALVFTLYLSFFPMLHRHEKTSSDNNCAACSLYNKTHFKQTPLYHPFTFHRTFLSSLVVPKKESPFYEFLFKINPRAPPELLA